MKKTAICILLLAFAINTNAQEKMPTSASGLPKNEVKWNIASTIIFGSVELGYEYFLDGHQSIGAEILINDAFNYGIARKYKDYNTNSFLVSYNYYTGTENNDSGLVISPLLKYRTGTYQRSDLDPKINMDSFILGIGAGYKWNYSNKFVFGPYLNIGRNFSQTVNDEFKTAVEFNAGFDIGYRF